MRDMLAIIRPFGLRRLTIITALTVMQSVMQLVAIFSLLPFLSAAADVDQFRQSSAGGLLAGFLGGNPSDQQLIVWTGSGSLAILLLGNATALFAEYARTQYATQLGHWLHVRLLSRVLERRYEYFLGINSSVLLKNLIEDIGLFSQAMMLPALDLVARCLMVLMLGLTILFFEPFVFLFAALTVVASYFIIVMPIRRRAALASDRIKRDMRGLYFTVHQILSGAKAILASDRNSHFVDRSARASKAVQSEVALIPILSAIPRSALEVLVFGGLICWVLVALLSGGDLVSLMPRVGLIAIVAYRLMPSLQMLFSQSMTITANRQSMHEIQQILSEQPKWALPGLARDPGALPRPLEWHDALEFENVGFSYANTDRAALSDIGFTVRKGERVAFVGPTGSGKSTLIDLLLGLLQPTSGRILVDGVPLDEARARNWRRSLGYVPQDLYLYDASIAENIAFGRGLDELDRARVARVAKIAHAAEFIERQDSAGYDAQVGERGVRLSGGQRQRLALARALYDSPSTLVLDEATSALDPRTEQGVVASLSEMHEKLTVITVTHRLKTIRDYDRIYFIQDGRIQACGTYEELERHPLFEAFSR